MERLLSAASVAASDIYPRINPTNLINQIILPPYKSPALLLVCDASGNSPIELKKRPLTNSFYGIEEQASRKDFLTSIHLMKEYLTLCDTHLIL